MSQIEKYLSRNEIEKHLTKHFTFDFENNYNKSTQENINKFWNDLFTECDEIFDDRFETTTFDEMIEEVMDQILYMQDEYDFCFDKKEVYSIEWGNDYESYNLNLEDIIDNKDFYNALENNEIFCENENECDKKYILNNISKLRNIHVNYSRFVEKTSYRTIMVTGKNIRESWLSDYFDTKTLFELDTDECYTMSLYDLKEDSNFDKETRSAMCEIFWSIDELCNDWVFHTSYNTSSIVSLWFCGFCDKDDDDEYEDDL
jgi:hypothetical protein